MTAYYDILDLEAAKTTCTDLEIKTAYRKQALLTHPDKNGHKHADEAFKMVSRAFDILGDKKKRRCYDRCSGDPDGKFSGAHAQNPCSSFPWEGPSGDMGGGGFGGRPFEGKNV